MTTWHYKGLPQWIQIARSFSGVFGLNGVESMDRFKVNSRMLYLALARQYRLTIDS